MLYDSKDLVTHAVCVGMTGSGKTGLCLALLEEAAIDGIPAILIDPKGDLANLLLTFPQSARRGFLPVDQPGRCRARRASRRKTMPTNRPSLWKKGLADWGEDGVIEFSGFAMRLNLSIYTPGSNAGVSGLDPQIVRGAGPSDAAKTANCCASASTPP